jgi:hypothetical protein
MADGLQHSAVEDAQARWETGLRYSICTMVTHPEQYANMLESFHARGFAGNDCEYLKVDNTRGNSLDAYQACNLFLSVARGDYIIICHQDIVLIEDDRARLDCLIAELDRLDARWALLGNSGCKAPGRHAVRISDPHGENQRRETFPARVFSLDENFILVRRDANLCASHDLAGFHLYGADLCVTADVSGRTAYVVDFHLRHLSGGTNDASLTRTRSEFINKYAGAFRSRWVMTPSVMMFLSSVRPFSGLMNSRFFARAAYWAGRIWR